MQALKFDFQGFAQHQNVAAVFHRHGQANSVLPHKAHARCRWIIEPTAHIGHVADAQRALTHANREALDLFNGFEITADAQLHALGRGLKKTCGRYRVLFLKGLLHGRQRQAQGRQFQVGQFDPDLFILQAEQLHLAHILNPLQLDLDAVGVVLEHRVVVTFATQAVDIAEGGAEFIVEKRPLHVRRQGMANVADFFAHLIPQVRDVRRVHGVAGHKGHLRLARPGKRNNALVFAGLHQLLFDALGDLTRHFFGGRTRPQGTNDHGLEGERRVFALS